MMNLAVIQKRFQIATEKKHWEKFQELLFSQNKESIVQGMGLIEQIDEEVYYDGICIFLEDDGKGNWKLKRRMDLEHELLFKVEILRMAEENRGHELREAFEKGLFDELFWSVCAEIEFGELSENQKERLLSKVTDLVEIEIERESILVMKYQLTQALWESIWGRTPSDFTGAHRPVENVSWFDCVIFANKWSEEEGLEKVYDIPKELTLESPQSNGLAKRIKVNTSASGYRLLTEIEWKFVAKGGENHKYPGSNDLDKVGWYDENSQGKTHPVGQKKANGYGLYDMSGNVWEWCFDGYDPCRRVIRGGGWYDNMNSCRLFYRNGDLSNQTRSNLGVRYCRRINNASEY